MFRIMKEIVLDMEIKVTNDTKTGIETGGKIIFKTHEDNLLVLECKVTPQEDNPGKFKAIFRPVFSREEMSEISKDVLRFKSIGCLVLY